MKHILLTLLILSGSVLLLPNPADPILEILQTRRWQDLAPYFADDSHQKLGDYFQQAKKLHFERFGDLEITYKAKFDQYGEMGYIIFEREGGKLKKVSIANAIKPLIFIEKIRKFTVNDRRIKIGEAEIHLRSGTLYQILPQYRSGIFFFEGVWAFSITPSDPEERLTLLRYFKSDTFSKTNNSGLFILPDTAWINQLEPGEELTTLPPSQLLNSLTGFLLDYFGLSISEFNETWFLSIMDKENLIAFEKDRKSFFIYDYNPDSTPDTQLRTTDQNQLFLNYNLEKQPRLFLGKKEELQEVKMNLYFNPEQSFFSGTATITLPDKSTFAKLNLNRGLTIRSATTNEYKAVSFFRKDDSYFVSFPETEKLTFYFNGTVNSDEEIPDLIKIVTENNIQKRVDEHYLLSRNLHFFPNTGLHFLKTSLKISLPDGISCIASGKLESRHSQSNRNTFHFTSSGSKGAALVCGNFKEQFTVDGPIPLRVFHTPDLRLKNYFQAEDLKKGIEFLHSRYGPLECPEINILFRRWLDDGGISNTGFVVMNLIELNHEQGLIGRMYVRESPVILTPGNRDFLIHELAHQWWGGKTSWSGYRDEWITEGMAHFSVLDYLQNTLSERMQQTIIDRIKRLVLKYQDVGPVLYGRRIANLDQYEAFQTIIYNKAALIILMLRDILGHEEFYSRIRSLLDENSNKSITTGQWIRHMAKNRPLAERFLNQWLSQRIIPELSYSYSQTADKVNVRLRQAATDFIIPIVIEIETDQGKTLHPVVTEGADMTFPIETSGQFRTLRINTGFAPIQVKRD